MYLTVIFYSDKRQKGRAESKKTVTIINGIRKIERKKRQKVKVNRTGYIVWIVVTVLLFEWCELRLFLTQT